MQSTPPKPKPQIPLCSCGGSARFDRRPTRVWYRERIVCASCGQATRYSYAGPNGEHRPELLGLWDQVTNGAERDCAAASAMIDGVVAGLHNKEASR